MPPVVRPALAGQAAYELGAVSGVGADGVGGLRGGAEGTQTGDDEAGEQADGGGGQLGGGEEGLGIGQGVGENHGGLAFRGG